MAKKDYYQILGISRNASEKEVKQAYRRLARRHHPDVNPGDKQAEERFKEINEAYEVLSDAEKRKKYDQFGDNWQYADQMGQGEPRRYPWGPQAGETFAGSGFDDLTDDDLGGIFDRLFRSSPGGQTFRRPRQGENVEQPTEITLEEAYQGTQRTILLQAEEPCPDCRGTGGVLGARCATCRGAGKVLHPRRLEVKIPPGVTDGSRVRVAGAGRHGGRRGSAGDLYLAIKVKPHDLFQRRNSDLHVEVPISLFTAILGGEVEVPTLKGKVMLKIPPETQNGRVFRLAGQGMPHLGTSERGELYAGIKVVLPSGLTEEEKKLLRQLRESWERRNGG
ncbi:MAG: J domain-containing protein [Chloroflexi bacterium]|nr:J domain-containing protein [Chloroflexota bacterium]